MKSIATIMLALMSATVMAQYVAHRDSILEVGRMWRDNKNYVAALDEFNKVGDVVGDYEVALTHYQMGKVAICVDECKNIVTADNDYSDDALVLLGLCRERQGFDRVATRIYKKLVKRNNAWGAYHLAMMHNRKGRLDKAEDYAQKSILMNKGNAEVHYLLASIEASKGERFKAMMSLYYYLLINDNRENENRAYQQLVNLWRRSSQTMEIIRRQHKADPFNNDVDNIINTWAVDDSIAKLDGPAAIEALYDKTDRLFRHLLSVSENNLDFWQVVYTDFFVTLVPRNFVKAYIYYISDATYHVDVMAWIAGDDLYFNEFRLWMEAQ